MLLGMPSQWFPLGLAFAVAVAMAGNAAAEPNLTGQTGLINMPDGRIEPDGTWRTGFAFQKPYSSIWGNVSILPRLEATARFTRIMGIPGFENNSAYGDYKDKVFQGKLLLLEESDYSPSLVFGLNDYLGTGLFTSRFLAASKQLGPVDLTLGVGNGRIDGAFAGARVNTPFDGLKLVAEYDANNYAQDKGADRNGVIDRKKGPGVGVEYRSGYFGTQVSVRDGQPGVNAYMSVPLNAPGFVPKVEEPRGYREVSPRPTMEEWQTDPLFRRRLVEVLQLNDFQDVGLRVEGDRLSATLSNSRISMPSRAIGRAARILMLLGPENIREIRVTYSELQLPITTYTFTDLNRLRRYFNGQVGRRELAKTVTIEYARPDVPQPDEAETWEGMEDARTAVVLFDKQDGNLLSFRGRAGNDSGEFQVFPKLSLYLNDPSGALRYQVFLRGNYLKSLGSRTVFEATADATVAEDVSKVTTPNNSTLPHVRTDVADYMRDSKARLTRAMVTHLMQPSERIYARASAGIYETMFAGAGGQILYVPRHSPWAFDLAADWVKQRDTKGLFGLRDYSTVTAIASAHTRLPIEGTTGTIRVGRFLAQDLGMRVELKRRFRSGVEMGAWYTKTNGHDITSPGTPENPYNDKGIFLAIPLNIMLPHDTRATASMQLSPWTRDVGQMLATQDLYQIVEGSYRSMYDRDGLRFLGDFDDDYTVPAPKNIADRLKWSAFRRELDAVSGSLVSDETIGAIGKGIGLVAISSALDRPFNRLGEKYQGARYSRYLDKYGKWSPILALGAAGLYALDPLDDRLSETAFTSVKAGVLAALAATGGKYLTGRARPATASGPYEFQPFSGGDSRASLPSGHTAVMWAAVTPFAMEYDMPWLYGAAALTGLGRVAGQRHWFSDTVAGALVGYGIGHGMWTVQRSASASETEVLVTPTGAAISKRF